MPRWLLRRSQAARKPTASRKIKVASVRLTHRHAGDEQSQGNGLLRPTWI